MNPWQMAQQIKAALAAVTWPTGDGDPVFGPRSVFVYAGAQPDENEAPPGFPFALVTIGTATADADDPDLLLQTFTIVVAVEVAGDPLGEFAVIGGARANTGRSAGAGVAEVAERVRSAVQRLTGADGAAMVVSGSGSGSPSTLGRGRNLAFDEFTVTALCTSQPHYTAPQQLDLVGGVFSWVGDNCSSRFDFLQYRLGYVVSDTPAEKPSDCAAIVYTGTHEQVAVVSVAGRTYSIFADYDPRGTGTPAASSLGNVVGAYVAP